MDDLNGRQRFLVVDDCEDARFLASRMIRKLHPDALVQVARGGAEALAMLHDANHGEGVIIFCDYDLGPGVTGTELLAQIARHHPRARRVLLTGHAPEMIPPASIAPDAILSKDGGMKGLRDFLAPRERAAAQAP